MTQALFIADLHLSADRPETLARFERFCATRARDAQVLYILGDLFDAWIGDDDPQTPAPEVREALAALTRAGTKVLIQHGNRDFLIGEAFCASTGATLLDEESVVNVGGIPTLLMHGDTLCTDDLGYQQARLMLRNPAFIGDFLAKPVAERRAIAAEYRRQSGEAVSLLAADIMDVNADAVVAALDRHNVRRLIHGHTHRPGHHRTSAGGEIRERIVLGEWHSDSGMCLAADDDGGLHPETV